MNKLILSLIGTYVLLIVTTILGINENISMEMFLILLLITLSGFALCLYFAVENLIAEYEGLAEDERQKLHLFAYICFRIWTALKRKDSPVAATAAKIERLARPALKK